MIALVATLVMALCASAAISAVYPQQAYAVNYSFVAGKASTPVRTVAIDAKVKKAYNRAVAACMDYRNQPDPIVVDVSDLGLTSAQALHVGYLLHGNGELFWINTYDDDSFKASAFTIPILNGYSDDTIDAMRAKLEKKVSKALSRITSGMDSVTKIHTLHDYLIDKIDYKASSKTAYDGLVLGKSDCFGFTRTLDLILKRAGFTVDVAYNNRGDHAWNLVKLGSKWYNIDLTWDNGYTGRYGWKKTRCHYYLLQPDSALQLDSARGNWWAHHKCTSKTYYKKRLPDAADTWDNYCKDYKLYTSGFTVSGLKYKAISKTKVSVAAVAKSKRSAKTLVIPATVTYKKKTYKVAGIKSEALANASATKLEVKATGFSKSRVKGSLTGSKVTKIALKGSATSKKAKYKTYFAASNSGKSVKVS